MTDRITDEQVREDRLTELVRAAENAAAINNPSGRAKAVHEWLSVIRAEYDREIAELQTERSKVTNDWRTVMKDRDHWKQEARRHKDNCEWLRTQINSLLGDAS